MTATEERLLSLEDVANRLQVSDQSVRRWIKAGKLAAYKPGLEWRIRPSDLENFLQARSYPKVQTPLPELEERRGERHVYRFDSEPRITAEQLREHGIEANNSEVIVLNQYIQLKERPPSGIVAVGHVVKEGEPVNHERVIGILLYLSGKGLLSPEETEAAVENVHRELAGARS